MLGAALLVNASKVDLISILTKVSRVVAREYESNSSQRWDNWILQKLAKNSGNCANINWFSSKIVWLVNEKIDKFVQKFWYVHKLIDVFTYREDFVQGFQPEEADSLYLFNSHRQNPLEVQEWKGTKLNQFHLVNKVLQCKLCD